MKLLIAVIIALLLLVGCGVPSPTAIVPTNTLAVTLAPPTETATDLPIETATAEQPSETLTLESSPTEPQITPSDIPTDVIIEPSLPAGIELSPTPENFTPVVEPSSTPLNASGILLPAAATAGLHMQGVTLVDSANVRFIISGINWETYRDYANGCGWVTDGTYNIRGIMADKTKALGVNAVRLNYSYRFISAGNSANLSRFLDMAQELAARGMYVMPSDHTYTGGVLTNAAQSYPTMKAIIDGMRARGIENYLIMNPFNEPGPDISVAQWVQAQKDVLTYLRNTAGFNGVVTLDGTGWATMLNVSAFQQVMAFDATLRGGAANVMFSHHLYPNIPSLPAQIWAASSQVPLTIGELGQENPGSSPLDPQYVKNTINGFLNTGRANGHNGLWAWIYQWCDTNKMLQDWQPDASVPYGTANPLSSHGVLWRDFYYNKLGGTPVATPAPIRSLTPSIMPTTRPPTATRTSTPTPTPAISLTPSITLTSTESPTPTDKPKIIITGEYGGTPFSAEITLP